MQLPTGHEHDLLIWSCHTLPFSPAMTLLFLLKWTFTCREVVSAVLWRPWCDHVGVVPVGLLIPYTDPPPQPFHLGAFAGPWWWIGWLWDPLFFRYTVRIGSTCTVPAPLSQVLQQVLSAGQDINASACRAAPSQRCGFSLVLWEPLLTLQVGLPMPSGRLPLSCGFFPLMFPAGYGVAPGQPMLILSAAWSPAHHLLGHFWPVGFPAGPTSQWVSGVGVALSQYGTMKTACK